jgi:hypothetical protein
MEQVADSVDPLGGQDLGNTRSNAFDILNRGGKFEHSLNLQESPPLGTPRRKLQKNGSRSELHTP